MRLLALTDHDAVDGIDEALQAGLRHGVRVVPAVEVSIVDAAAPDLHVLGYGIDHHDPGLRSALGGFCADRRRRAECMAATLREIGFAIDEVALRERCGPNGPVGRPHLAEAVLAERENDDLLSREGIADVSAFIDRYLVAGCAAFAGRSEPGAQAAIDLIHAAGGIAVWAHPFWDIGEPEAVLATLARFRAAGIDGVEAFYVTHDAAQTACLAGAAAHDDLLTTGSSDFHGPEHRIFSRFRAFELHGRQPRLGALLDPAADHHDAAAATSSQRR